MNYVNFATRVRQITETDDNTFPDSELKIIANINKDEICQRIINKYEDYLAREFETDLIAGEREYPFPPKAVKVGGVQAYIDGEWRRCREFDLTSYGSEGNLAQATTDEDSIQANFSNTDPKYELRNRQIIIYSGDAIEAYTNGLKFYGSEYSGDITDFTNTLDMSQDISSSETGLLIEFHDLLAQKCAIDFGMPDAKKRQIFNLPNWEVMMERTLKGIKKQNKDRKIEPTVPNRQDYKY